MASYEIIVAKLSFDNKDAPNNSINVSAKQLLSFNGFSLSLGLREGGFRPRHLSRCATSDVALDSF